MQERPWHHHYDAEVPRTLDYERTTLPEYLLRSAARFPDRTALAFLGRRVSYGDLARDVRRCAEGLAALGVRPGSKVAIQLPNLPQTVVAFYATLLLGAQAVMTNPLYTVPELRHQWTDAGCEVAVVADYVFAGKLAQHRAELPVREWVVASIPEYLPALVRWIARGKLRRKGLWARVEEGPGVRSFAALLKESEPRPGDPASAFDDLAVLQYTGGTTGVSKGAMLTHANLSSNVQQIDAWFTCFEPGREVMLTALPLFHVFGLTVCMNWPIAVGATLVLLPDPRDVARIVGAIEKERVTVLPAVPAMFNAINHFDGVEGRDLSSVKACFSGSAPLAEDVRERFERMTGARILEGFGLTETSPVTHVNPLGGVRKPGTIGLPVSDTDARLRREDGSEPGPGEPGELVLRGPQVMRGYWNKPAETEGCLKDGWLRTGDLAEVDQDGYFRIVGRVKDMIKAGGYNVYPDEVDGVLVAHPEVLEAATIGVPDERRGETVKSFVVLRPGGRATADEIEAWCRERLAAYKVPREVEFLDELPKSTVLKVLRRELRERELARRAKHT